jgi:hypothetical protein
MVQRPGYLHRRTRVVDPEQFNADQLAYWNGPGGREHGLADAA